MNPPKLPIDAHLPALVEHLRAHPTLVLVAPPGAGKTTRVPPALLDAGVAGTGKVLVLQPRRVAARAAARRMAEERGGVLGDEVGFCVRFEDRTGPRTRLEVLTEGLLTRRLQSDPFLSEAGCVVLDEIHERHLHTDLALALLREVQRTVRPDLKLVAMSATAEAGPLAAFLDAPIITVEGRTFPVAVAYDPRLDERPLTARVVSAVRAELSQTPGDVLVFLPGAGEIAAVQDALTPLDGVEILPLHGSLPSEAQDRALYPGATRRVVLATNVAETSVTLPGVTSVVDSGLARVPRFEPALGLTRLELKRISQASATQRAGRAGRVAPGRCRRLWLETEPLAAFESPELTRADLSRLVLELLAWGAIPEAFPFLEPPPAAALAQGRAVLSTLGALTATGQLSALGAKLLALPLEPRLARVVLAGHASGRLKEAATLAALVSERDLLPSPPAVTTDSDLHLRLTALSRVERGQRDPGVDGRAARTLLATRDQLIRLAQSTLGPPPPPAPLDLPALLLAGFPDRVAKRRGPGSDRFKLASGAGALLEPQSTVRGDEWVLAVSLVAGERGERAEHRIRIAEALDPETLPLTARRLVRFDEARESVWVMEQRRYGELVVRERTVAGEPEEVAKALAEAACRAPERALTLSDETLAWVNRVRWLAGVMPELALPTFPELTPAETPGPLWQTLCQGLRSFAELRRLALKPLLRAALGRQATEVDRLAPPSWTLADGSEATLHYEPGAPPVLTGKIQQFFGMLASPKLAQGRATVLIHLLAPNYRPAQVTQDLASFWRTTYAEVRKELRGRYPKHDWPEDPYTAQASRGPKRRPPS